MRKYILSLLSILGLSTALVAQNATEVAYQSAYKMCFKVLKVSDNHYYVGSDNWHQLTNYIESNKVVKFTKSGEYVWERELLGYSRPFIREIYEFGDEIWCISNQLSSCDAISEMRSVLHIIDDATSSILLEKTILTSGINTFSKCEVMSMQNGNIIVAMGDSLAAINSDGNIIWKKEHLTGSTFGTLAESLSGEILLTGSNGIDVYDNNGNYITNHNGIGSLKLYTTPTGYIYIFSSTIITAYPSFGVNQTEDLSAYLEDISDVGFINGEFFISGQKTGEPTTSVLIKLDTSLTFVDSVEFKNTYINALTSDGDTMVVAGEETFSHTYGAPYDVKGAFIKAFDNDLSNHVYQNDGEIIGMVIDSSYISNLGQPSFIESKIKVQIRNNGQEYIQHVALSHTNPVASWLCTYFYSYKDFDVNIAPGQDTLLEYGWLTHQVYTSTQTTASICLILSSAGYMDDDHSNNTYCKTYSIPVGINETTTNPSNLSIFPNPAQDKVNISFELNKATDFSATIYDVSGRQVALLGNQNYASGKHQVTWDASAYPSGLYYCHITIGDETVVKKMSVTH